MFRTPIRAKLGSIFHLSIDSQGRESLTTQRPNEHALFPGSVCPNAQTSELLRLGSKNRYHPPCISVSRSRGVAGERFDRVDLDVAGLAISAGVRRTRFFKGFAETLRRSVRRKSYDAGASEMCLEAAALRRRILLAELSAGCFAGGRLFLGGGPIRRDCGALVY